MGVLLAGCASAPKQKTTGIRLGMTQDELAQEWGKPSRVRPPVVNKHGQTEVVVEYTRKRHMPGSGTEVAKEVLRSGSGLFDNPTEKQRYLFHFIDDRLARWGPDETGDEPVTQDPTKADPTKTDPTKTDPTKTDPIKTEPTKDPKKTDPTKTPGKNPATPPKKDPKGGSC
ncbi:MAG: hypothetical protein ACYS5W_13385 [Planctomycetota bacterium]